MPLSRIVYVSRKRPEVPPGTLVAMVEMAQIRNEKEDITGILLYAKGCFLQVLEGDPERVAGIFARIRVDKRHDSVFLVSQGPIRHRSFGAWRMGFVALADLDVAKGGYGPFPVDLEGAIAFAEGMKSRLLAV